ncbi:MAG: asparagine synthase (glutamine-hydrolyzing) [Crocinitomicaceae bacterium]|nr:asparagine synthase (glutamine-hydrolyzing) [Crocinitomicaceae bacterium]
MSIIDLDVSSNQPFESDGLHIIFNGEIFNYLELRNELGNEYQFRTNSDTEVILQYYRKHGIAGFEKFNGMWAFVIYDSIRKKIIISRDRFSIKPLYIVENNGTILLSSEIKALKKCGLSLSPDVNSVERFLNQMLIDTSLSTFYNEIKIFPAMTAREIDLKTGKTTDQRYWNFSMPEMPAAYGDRKEVFRNLLLDSLKLRLRSDVPLGTLLSGGLDSSAITALIHDHINKDVQSFSVVSDERGYSEESFVDLLVKQKSIHNNKLLFRPEDALENIDRVLQIQDEPFGSLSVVAQYLLFEKIKKEANITVLLSGQGADEVLLGYHKYFFFYLQQLKKNHRYFKLGGQVFSSLLKGISVKQFTWKQAKRYLPGRTNRGRDYFTRSLQQDAIWQFDSITDRQIQDINHFQSRSWHTMKTVIRWSVT